MVHPEELVGARPVGARHPQQPALELLAEPRPGLVQGLVVVQGLARRRQPEPVGVQHGPHEEGPLGQHVGHRVADQHPLRVEPVRASCSRGVGEHEGLPPHPCRGVGRGRRRRAAVKPSTPLAPAAQRRRVGPRPRRPPTGSARPATVTGPVAVSTTRSSGQVGRVRRGEPLDDLGGQQLGGAAAGPQRDVGARARRAARGRATRHTCRRRGPTHSQVSVAAGPAGRHPDLVGDEEARQQADAELPEEALAGQAEGVALGRGADRREHAADAVLVEADAGVLDVQAARRGRRRPARRAPAAARRDPPRCGR